MVNPKPFIAFRNLFVLSATFFGSEVSFIIKSIAYKKIKDKNKNFIVFPPYC